eukprot:SAG11_NODE_8975_length_957_cov_1.437063_1_plen_62_part_10
MLDTNNAHHCVQQDERIPKLVEKISQLNFSVFFHFWIFPSRSGNFQNLRPENDPKTVPLPLE